MILLQDSSQLPHLPSPRLGNLLQVARLPNPLLALEPPWKPGYLQLAPLSVTVVIELDKRRRGPITGCTDHQALSLSGEKSDRPRLKGQDLWESFQGANKE